MSSKINLDKRRTCHICGRWYSGPSCPYDHTSPEDAKAAHVAVLRRNGDYQELARSRVRYMAKHGYSQPEYRRYGGITGIVKKFPPGGERVKKRKAWAQRQIDQGVLTAPDNSKAIERLIRQLKAGGHIE